MGKRGGGGGGMEVGEKGAGDYIPVAIHCHHQNDSRIKISGDESHFNVSLIVRDSHKTMSTNHNPFEEKGEQKTASK